MKTAEEIYRQITGCTINHGDIKTAMIEFAKLHVEQALKEASISKSLCTAYTEDGLDYKENKLCKHSVLNAYPLEKIM
jgi:hypothetical protein